MTDHDSASPNKLSMQPFVFDEPVPLNVGPPQDQISIAQLWNVLQKRWWLIVGSVIIITLVVAIYSATLPKRYDASARILLDMEASDNFGLEQSSRLGVDLTTKLETQINILRSNTIASSVIDELRLAQDKSSGRLITDHSHHTVEASRTQQRAGLINELHNSLFVLRVPQTEIIEIHFRSEDPNLATDITNCIAATYIERNFQTKYKSVLQTADWLTKQLDDLKTHADTAEEQLIEYQRKTGILGTDETHNIIVDKLGDLNKELSVAEGDRIVKEAKYRIADTENPELIAYIAPQSPLGDLYKQRFAVKAEYAQMAGKYGAAYPRVVQLQSQLDELNLAINAEIVNVREAVHADYKTSLTSEQMLKKSFDNQKQAAYSLNENAIQYAIMRRDVESSRDLYEGLLKKLKEAGIMAGLKSGNLNIIDPATVPTNLVEPRTRLNLELGCIGGLLFGLALAFVVENVDHSIRTPQDVENYCSLPTLGFIPRIAVGGVENKNGHKFLPRSTTLAEFIPPVAMQLRDSGAAEAFRALRSSLLLSSPDRPPQVIMVTSATKQEGKTITALNLSVVLAQTGQSVLLVDADMRRPSVNKYLGIPMNRGLSACLAGIEDPDAVVLKVDELVGLHVITAGRMPSYPSEMLASEAMTKLVLHWRDKYRYIVIDTPPVLAVTDAVVCARNADAVVLIARSEVTHRQSLLRARDVLKKAHANIAGVVVNDLSINSADYRQYYGQYGSRNESYYHHSGNKNGNS
jgi:polysaccharide biosynthesis transport protein